MFLGGVQHADDGVEVALEIDWRRKRIESMIDASLPFALSVLNACSVVE